MKVTATADTRPDELDPPDAEVPDHDVLVAQQVVELLSMQIENRDDRAELADQAPNATGRKKITLAKKIAAADTEYADRWALFTERLGADQAAALRSLLEEQWAQPAEDRPSPRGLWVLFRGEATRCACGERLADDEEFDAGICVNCGAWWPDEKLRRETPPPVDSPEFADIEEAHWDSDHAKVDSLVAAWIAAHPAPVAAAPELEAPAAAAYPHCACGAVLALPAEQAVGACEACAPLQVKAHQAWIPPAETTDAGAAGPQDVPLPFPPAPVPPFDFHAALVDITEKNRAVESLERVYQELKERTADAKKQWEAAASAASLAISEYDRKAREAEAYAERQAELQAAYVEKLEAEAAKAAAPELPLETPCDGKTGTEVAANGCSVAPQAAADAPTSLSDALPTCQLCENKLALDTELEKGICEDCAK